MLKIALIRHAKTYGNTLGRYIGGRTDEPLCEEGICLLKGRTYPCADYVYVSPMKRCRETAQWIYPKLPMEEKEGFRECDFGIFENKSFADLTGNAAYQAWIDSNGSIQIPQGESREAFRRRCTQGFCECVEDAFCHDRKQIAMVVHGGTIMSILSSLAVPKKDYFEWQIENGGCYELLLEREVWEKEHCLCSVKKR